MRLNALLPALALCAVVVPLHAAKTPVEVRFDASAPGGRVVAERMNGTCLPIWNSAERYDDIKHGLQTAQFHLLRFPNGSLSNDYHWNGKGAYTPDGTWECDTNGWEPGFVCVTKHRGTSKHHYGFEGASHLTDGDTGSMWWSDPLIEGKDPYFYLDFGQSTAVDSVVIRWGERYAVEFDVDVWEIGRSSYPGPHQANPSWWKTVKAVTGNTSRVWSAALDTSMASHYLRVIARQTSGSGTDVQVCEIYAYADGERVTVNVDSYAEDGSGQTRAIAVSTHPGSGVREDWATGWVDWDFEAFMAYVNGLDYDAEPVICVNYGTGTPEEAAAWVRYANVVKDYGIRYWQVGNEMDGAWEEGGPVSAETYAEKYVRFAKAMKAVDPAITVFGPVMAGADFGGQASGDYNDKSWMHSFLAYVGAREQADGATYLDGIDFHCYPYWFSGTPIEYLMAPKSDYVYDRSDLLLQWMHTYLREPDSVMVFMSEYNSSVVMSSLLHKPVNAVCLANMFAGLAEKFTHRAMTVVWDSFEGGGTGPDGTHGSLSLFNPRPDALHTSMTLPPSAAWWACYITGTLWLDTESEQRMLPSDYDRSGGLRAYAVAGEDDARVLLLNLSADTLDIGCALDGAAYDSVDIFTWGEREFRWIGDTRDAYAMPNCGPSSSRLRADSLRTVTLPPLSIGLLRFHSGGLNGVLSAVHSGAFPRMLRGDDTLRVWGSWRADGAGVGSIEYAVDTGTYTPLPSIDGACDGPSESWVLTVAGAALPAGDHAVRIRAIAGADTLVDTVAFSVGGRLRAVALIDDFVDSNLTSALPSGARWTSHAHGANESSIELALPPDGPGETHLAAEFSIVQPPELAYPNFAVVQLRLDRTWIDTVTPALQGITFTYASSHSTAAGAVTVNLNSRQVTDYDQFHVTLENTGGAWKTVTLGWSDFAQHGWGENVGPLDPAQITTLEFRATGEGTGVLRLDDLAFVSDTGELNEVRRRGAAPLAGGARFVALPRRGGKGILLVWSGMPVEQRQLRIYDSRGMLVDSIGPLHRKRTSYVWNVDATGGGPASGLYVFRLSTPGATVSARHLLLR